MTTTAEIYAPIQDGLAKFEEHLRKAAEGSNVSLEGCLEHILHSTGKRVRPAVTLLASKFAGKHDESLPILMASAIELLHIATLIHDDAVDKSDTRRGQATISSLFGQDIAMLVGDYVFAKSATVVCDTKNVRVIRTFAETIMALATGELREIWEANDWEQTRQKYFTRIFDKTGSLFCTAAECGALLSDAPETTVQAMKTYGYNVGMAFQIVDDIIDYEGDPAEVGKPIGGDLIKGTFTLPAMIALERFDSKSTLKNLMDAKDEPSLKKAVEYIRSTEAIQASYVVAREFQKKALDALAPFPDIPAKRSLKGIAEYVLERRK